jgi:hypothetical protein
MLPTPKNHRRYYVFNPHYHFSIGRSIGRPIAASIKIIVYKPIWLQLFSLFKATGPFIAQKSSFLPALQ